MRKCAVEIVARTASPLAHYGAMGSAFATRRAALPSSLDLEGNSLGAAVAVLPVHRISGGDKPFTEGARQRGACGRRGLCDLPPS